MLPVETWDSVQESARSGTEVCRWGFLVQGSILFGTGVGWD